MPTLREPAEIAARLGRRVRGQTEAVREMATALAKWLSGLRAGNILLIGSSGTGKTTLMRAVEDYLAGDRELAGRSTLIRIHANLLAHESEAGRPGEVILARLLERARQALGAGAAPESLLERLRHGLVLVDEIDKIRSRLDGTPHPAGLRAQEALLTVMENERIPLTLPAALGGETVEIDASGLLFVGAGAFESLYDMVYDRVTVGRDQGALQGVTVVDDGELREEMHFSLRDWLRSEDLFDYGMTPQFLSRFESVVLLEDLSEDDLVSILLETPDSGLVGARAYFESFGIELALSPSAARRIAEEARRQPRLGARALGEVLRRVMRVYEFEPRKAAPDGVLAIDLPEVDAALDRR